MRRPGPYPEDEATRGRLPWLHEGVCPGLRGQFVSKKTNVNLRHPGKGFSPPSQDYGVAGRNPGFRALFMMDSGLRRNDDKVHEAI